jgi:hypothetical protein
MIVGRDRVAHDGRPAESRGGGRSAAGGPGR